MLLKSYSTSAQTFWRPLVCQIKLQVAKILYCFANTFRRVPKKHSQTSAPAAEADLDFVFAVNLDFKEEDGKGGFTPCPRDKNVFKLRCNLDKQIAITVSQTAGKELKIER